MSSGDTDEELLRIEKEEFELSGLELTLAC